MPDITLQKKELMKINIEEADENVKYYVLSEKKGLKKNLLSNQLLLDAGLLGLSFSLYGKTKQESIKIQKNSSKNLIKLYRICKKVIKSLGVSEITFYAYGLKNKKNNNDFMLIAMLETGFAKRTDRFKLAYESACEFLDKENSLNNMCDFKGNRCAKHRAKGIDKNTGCCASFCKLRVDGTSCPHKNLSCKIFMCDYLIKEKGFYFTPNTLAILKLHFSPLERVCTFGLLCRTEKKSLKFLRFIRFVEFLYVLVFVAAVGLIIFGAM